MKINNRYLHSVYRSKAAVAASGRTLLGVALAFTLSSPARAQSQGLYVANFFTASIEKFGLPTAGTGTLFANNVPDLSSISQPQFLAFDAQGNLYVTNRDMNSIERYTSFGLGTQFVSSNLSTPEGLAFDKLGNLYVANTGDGSIEKFNSTGGGATRFDTTGTGTIHASSPRALAFDATGNLYVASEGDDKIIKYNTSGVGSVFVTDPGTNTVLNQPNGLAFDSSGNLYVSNAGSTSIRKFDSSGAALTFTTTGTQPGIAQGLAFDASGNLYVADSAVGVNGNRIVKYTTAGVGSVYANTNMNGPTGIAIGVATPEPGSIALLVSGGLTGIGLMRRRRKRA